MRPATICVLFGLVGCADKEVPDCEAPIWHYYYDSGCVLVLPGSHALPAEAMAVICQAIEQEPACVDEVFEWMICSQVAPVPALEGDCHCDEQLAAALTCRSEHYDHLRTP